MTKYHTICHQDYAFIALRTHYVRTNYRLIDTIYSIAKIVTRDENKLFSVSSNC